MLNIISDSALPTFVLIQNKNMKPTIVIHSSSLKINELHQDRGLENMATEWHWLFYPGVFKSLNSWNNYLIKGVMLNIIQFSTTIG